MFETAAILMWLCDDHAELMPTNGATERAHALQWMFWLANTLHPTLRMLFYPEQYVDGDTKPLHDKAKTRLRDHLDILEGAATAPWRDTGAPSAHAFYLGPMLRWAALYGGGPDWFDLTQWPRLYSFAQAFETTKIVQKAVEAEGLGPTPLSAPSPCNPPEGRAL